MAKFIEERLEQLEEDLSNTAEYFQTELLKQVEINRNMSLMVDNISKRTEFLEEQMAVLVEALGKIE